MPVIFYGATSVPAGVSLPVLLGPGAATGAVAGLALGVVTGRWLLLRPGSGDASG